jgi:hypothetical protein
MHGAGDRGVFCPQDDAAGFWADADLVWPTA